MTFPKGIIDALCCMEAFRRLGFTPDELFVRIYDTPQFIGTQIGIEIQKEPGFLFRVCDLWCSEDEFEATWKEAVYWWNNKSNEEEHKRLYNKSEIRSIGTTLIIFLQQKGFNMGELLRKKQAN